MSERRTPSPSPLVGDGAERLRREAGEGAGARDPSPGHAESQSNERRDRWFAANDFLVLRGRSGGKLKLMEVYDPRTGRFEPVGEMQQARFKIPDAALRLTDGRILVAGDADKPELIDPKTWKTRTVNISLGDTFNFAGAALLPNGDVLVAGGYGERSINPTSRAWIIPRAAMA